MWESCHTWELRYLLQQANVHDMYKLCCKKELLYFLQQLFATCNNLFGARQVRFVGGKMGNNTIQLSLQQCCKTTCMVFLPVLLLCRAKRARERETARSRKKSVMMMTVILITVMIMCHLFIQRQELLIIT